MRACGTARFCFNWGLAEWKRQHEAGEKPSAFALKKAFNAIQSKEFPWVGEVNSHAKQQAFADLGKAFQNFFRRVKKGEKPGYPKFKARGKCRDSFYLANIEFKIEGNRIKLPKGLGWIRMCEPLRFHGKIMSARISRTADNWYIAIQVDMADPTPIHTSIEESVGIHLGVRHMAVTTAGEIYDPPKPLNKHLKKLAREQRTLSKRQKGSKRYRKQQAKLQRTHKRIADIRSNSQHQMTAMLTKQHSALAVQAYDIRGMTKNGGGTVENPGENVWLKRRFNRHNLDVGMFEIRRQLEYKAAITGTELSVIDAA